MNKMERVLRQALATFSGPYTSKTFHDNLVGLMRSADELDAPSVGLDVRLLWRDAHELDLEDPPPPPPSASRRLHRIRAPVTYIDVFENEDVSVGVFVLRDGATIPLHDHPYMYGVLKVIRGKVRIQSYTPRQTDYSRLDDSIISAKKLPPIIVGENDKPCVLCPHEGNIHQVDTVDGPAAFIDILAPPYRENNLDAGKRQRRCSYYVEVNNRPNDVQLKIVSDPINHYWSDSARYTGPAFSVHF